MLNAALFEESLSNQQLEKALKFFRYTMESVNERLLVISDKTYKAKLPYHQLMGGFLKILDDNKNFPSGREEIQALCIEFVSEYLDKGLPEKFETDYERLCKKIIGAIAVDERAIAFIDENYPESR